MTYNISRQTHRVTVTPNNISQSLVKRIMETDLTVTTVFYLPTGTPIRDFIALVKATTVFTVTIQNLVGATVDEYSINTIFKDYQYILDEAERSGTAISVTYDKV